MTEELCAWVKSVTLRESARRQVARHLIRVPPLGRHLWDWFWELDRERQINPVGGQSISSSQMAAWARLSGVEIRPWEFRVLCAMDSARLAGHHEGAGRGDAPVEPDVSGMLSSSDSRGVGSLLRGLAARSREVFGG